MNRSLLFVLLLSGLVACRKAEPPSPATRTYRMGHQNSAPSLDNFELLVQSLKLWTPRADAAIITTEVPWDSLDAGLSAERYITNQFVGLVRYYRSLNLKLWVYIDPANGLNRAADANALVARGKSMTQADVQARYRQFVLAMTRLLQPDHLGLALETNLIRASAPPALYQGIKKAVNAAAADLRAAGTTAKLSVSVQAETAWGRLGGTGTYVGVEQDFADFPFVEELGISSYPYFGFARPADLPDDYYARLTNGRSLPVFVSEGGWTSETLRGPGGELIASSPGTQRDYIARQGQLLDKAGATAVFQLLFTDLDLTKLPAAVDPSIRYFAFLGLVDKTLQPKPALDAWDALFKRPLSP
jgi:hypothetical protein